jgi:hypothetical protein
LVTAPASRRQRTSRLFLQPRYAAYTVSETQRDLEQAIAGILKPLGYTKRAAAWHRDRNQVVSVLNLQKSQWGDDWYLNLGVYLKALGEESRPAEARCHVRCRAATLGTREMPRDPTGVAALVDEVVVPWIEALSTERGVSEFLASERASVCFVHRHVWEALGAPDDAPAAKRALGRNQSPNVEPCGTSR